MVNGVRIVCGLLALGLSVAFLEASAARSTTTCGHPWFIQVDRVSAGGCWHRTGSRWRASTPVTLNGLKLTGAATVTADPDAGTITSSQAVRWLIGSMRFRQAPFAWQAGSPLRFSPSGRVRGLRFAGAAVLKFMGGNGGTARLAAKLAIPGAGNSVTGSAVFKVSRGKKFDVRRVHVRVGTLAVGRLFFRNMDFQYAHKAWSAGAEVRLPAFTGSDATLAGRLAVSKGDLHDISVQGKRLAVPLGEGFVLTNAGLALQLGPLVIQGSASATYGPPIAGHAPLRIDGKMQYSSVPERWEATGKVTLPWGLPGVKPSAKVGLEIRPGRSMSFSSDLDLTVHGMGLTASLDGFASARAFNAEGAGALKLPLVKLSGHALVSSNGLSACGTIKLLFLRKKLGFGYTWNGPLDIMGSSCDVGRYRVAQLSGFGVSQALGPIVLSSPAGFTVFAAKGGDFQVNGPTGVYASTPDRDETDAFAFHDTSTNTAYLAIRTLPTTATYTITPLNGAVLETVSYANGLKTHAPPAVDVTATVSGSGKNLTLNYVIQTSQFQPGETVSFYEGQSPSVAGAAPIVEGVTASGTARFAPEPLGSTTRYVFAVVSIDGRPREAFPVATFQTTPVAPPSAAVFLRPAQASPGWTIEFGKPQGVATWQLLTTASDGSRSWQEVPGTANTADVPASAGKPATIQATPVDEFGREGPTYVCNTSKPGFCPAS